MTTNTSIPWTTLVDDEERDRRYSICKSCDKFTENKTCSITNAIMPVNTVWADASCPTAKWLKVTTTN